MNKVIVLLVIFVATVFLTGCGGGSGTTVGQTFIGGTEGLRTTFLPGSPPDRTTDGSTSGFSIVVKAENIGETDVDPEDGYVQIWGLDAGTYSATQYANFKQGFTDPIRGAVKSFDGSVIDGGVSTIEFGDLSYTPVIQGDLPQTIWANICYRYTTKVATQICVKNTAEQALNGKQICEVEGEKNPQNSGGPIQVTSLKESYAGTGKMGLTLTITHSGTGDAFFKDDGNNLNCNNVESNNDKGKVKVEFDPVQVNGKSIRVDCPSLSDDGYVRLFGADGQAATQTVYCTVDVAGGDTSAQTPIVVQVPLSFKLSYVYLQHIEQNMNIRHISK
jgi:hypothetical protein